MGSGTQSAFKKILTIATKWSERRAGQCSPRGFGGEQPAPSVPDRKLSEGMVRPLHVCTLLRGKDRLPKRGSPPSPRRGGRCEAKLSGLQAEGCGRQELGPCGDAGNTDAEFPQSRRWAVTLRLSRLDRCRAHPSRNRVAIFPASPPPPHVLLLEGNFREAEERGGGGW